MKLYRDESTDTQIVEVDGVGYQFTISFHESLGRSGQDLLDLVEQRTDEFGRVPFIGLSMSSLYEIYPSLELEIDEV